VEEEDFANNILKVIQDDQLRQELAQKAKAGAQQFTAVACATRMRTLYEQIVAANKR
jgi:hypothetical protein